MRRLRAIAVGVLAIAVAGACGSSETGDISASPEASPTLATVPPEPSSTPPTRPSPTQTPSGPSFSLVGLGDSVAGGLKCESPCQSYVLTFGELAEAALSMPVNATNLATNDGLYSSLLLERVEQEAPYRSAIAAADIITLQVGGNDWQGPCNFENHLTCLPAGLEKVRPRLDGILSEIVALRAGRPTALRVVTYYNGFLGNIRTPSIWSFPARPSDIAAFDTDFRQALLDFNAMICELAVAHGAVCVDIAPAFNGPNEDTPAASGLINADGAHALEAGQNLIAETLAAAGFEEIE